MTDPCTACNAYPARQGKLVCNGCIERTRGILADQEENRQELLIKLARDTKMAAPNDGGRSTDPGLAWSLVGSKYLDDITDADTARRPYDVRAGDMLREQRALLEFWTKLLRDELSADLVPMINGPVCQEGAGRRDCPHLSCRRIVHSRDVYTVAGMAVLIELWLDRLAGHTAAPDLVVSLRVLQYRIMAAIDYPENRARIHVGLCPVQLADKTQCPGEVEALFPRDQSRQPVMRCRYCRTEWPSWTWNRTGQLIMNRRRIA